MSSLNIKMNQLNKIQNGQGIQHILDKVHEIMGNPALIFDMEYKLIASPTDAVNDDPIWCEFMTHGKLSDETIEFFKNESFIDSVANCTQFDGVTYLFSNQLKYNRIFGQLYNKARLPVADLVMVACENPFEDYTPELIKTVCNILSEEISQNEYYQHYGQSYQDSIIKKLIDGSIEDRGIYSGHVSNIEKGLKAHVFLAVAAVAQSNLSSADLEPFRESLKRAEPAFKYSIYSNYIAFLISSDSPVIRLKKDLSNLLGLIEKKNIHIGISSSFEDLFELHQYYLEAVYALYDGVTVSDNQRINVYQKKEEL